ncbi:MAG: aspartate aminotransferase family protein [Gammaproteobacteria bacterium]|nr:aspartate aminotransferase family protein [Gammaproteobacteria bacterium]
MPSPSHVFPRNPRIELPTAVSGHGCWLVDANGTHYLDASGGAAVSCLGHSPKAVIDATCQQLQQLAYAHTSFFTSDPAERLAAQLVEQSPDGLDWVYFVSGGSEAIEAAIKLARQYFLEIGQPDRAHLIARRQSYHGNTLGALAAGGNQWRRRQFEPLLSPHISHISPCHYWRWGEPGESPEAYGRRVADELEAEILRVGPERVAAFLAEPVVGATMGAVPAVAGYFRRIREICDTYGVLLILDEVMCGMGRTGSLFACTDEAIVPDIVCIAKGLGAGIQPIGAMLCQDAIYRAIVEGSGFFQHGHTYIGHPTACAAGLAVLQEIANPERLKQVRDRGNQLQQTLSARLAQHPLVGDIRGRGLFVGLELVSDRLTKSPLSPDLKIASRLKAAAMAHGLMCYPMSGTIDGHAGDHVLLAPPFIISEDEIELLADRLVLAMNQVLPTHAACA